jgi:hypothetical protein
MGMFDTIIFDRPIPSPKCEAEIRSDRPMPSRARSTSTTSVTPSVAHAEQIRVVCDEPPEVSKDLDGSNACEAFTMRYYLAVYRSAPLGVVGIERDTRVHFRAAPRSGSATSALGHDQTSILC